MALLAVHGLGLARSGAWAFRGVRFDLEPGEALAVVGSSGAGKSSLLHALLGLLEPTEGRVHLAGEPWSGVPERLRRNRRRVIQGLLQEPQVGLPPHRTGWEVVEAPLTALEACPPAARRERAAQAATRAGLPLDALERRPPQLSGGMALRLALARALVVEPALLVLDEPQAGLDAPLSLRLEETLAGLQARGLALVVATHDLAAARRACGRVLHLEAGQVRHCGTWAAAKDLDRAFAAVPRLPGPAIGEGPAARRPD